MRLVGGRMVAIIFTGDEKTETLCKRFSDIAGNGSGWREAAELWRNTGNLRQSVARVDGGWRQLGGFLRWHCREMQREREKSGEKREREGKGRGTWP
ncbi:hypothetical protein PanWU01x14_352480, partial [Parasponia andersonii]